MTFSFTAPGSLGAPDANGRVATAKSWLEGKNGELDDKGLWVQSVIAPNGKIYTLYNPLQSVLMIPFILVSKYLPLEQNHKDQITLFLLSTILFPFLSALSIVCIYLSLQYLGYSKRTAFFSSLLVAFSTSFLAYARIAQEENLLALSFSIWLLGITRYMTSQGDSESKSLSLASLGGCMAIATKFSSAIMLISLLLATVIILFKKRPQSYWVLVMPFAICGFTLSALALYNNFRFGSPLESGYGIQFHYLNVKGFDPSQLLEISLALLFSPYRGLFLFCPALFLWVWHCFKCRGAQIYPLITVFPFIGFALTLILTAGTPMWHSGFSWGPRYLVAPMVFMGPIFAFFLKREKGRMRKLGFLLILLSTTIQLSSTVFPHSRENMIRILEKDHRCKSLWSLQCSPIYSRITGIWEVPKNLTETYPPLLEEVTDLESILSSSDFKTFFWWPFRLSIRFNYYSLTTAFLIFATILGSAITCLVWAYKQTTDEVILD